MYRARLHLFMGAEVVHGRQLGHGAGEETMKGYSNSIALIMAQLSAIAYKDGDLRESINKLGVGLVLIKSFGRKGDLSGFLCRNKDYAVLVFQGTDIRDWETIKEDLKFWPTKKGGVRYADGFYDAYLELLPEFEPDINMLPLTPLYITGHSLGGAIATITALNRRHDRMEACYTFGAPRVCNYKGLKKDNNKAIYRLIHENDIVPSLPLFIMGYIGVGQLVYISANNDIRTGYKAYISRVLAQALPLIKYTVFSLASFVKNHLIQNYIEALLIADYRERVNL